MRQIIGKVRRALWRRRSPIREWVERTFTGRDPKIFLELGAHCGSDTEWLAAIPGVTLHAFEPDPRNLLPDRRNVIVHRAAIGDRDGRAPFILSAEGWGRPWTYSSSLKSPKAHLQRYPVTFGGTIEVETVALDSFRRRAGLRRIDFIWADIQGAEGDMIRGGIETLACTRYLYTEYSNEELYAGQVTLDEILAMLPHFRVLQLWPDDVLLENMRPRTADDL